MELADVGVDAPRQLAERVSFGVDPGLAHEAAQDGEPGGEVRRLDGDRQAPLEAVAQRDSRLESSLGIRSAESTIWLPAFVEGVEGVEELVLGVPLALEELDVVDEQDVEVAVAALERFGAGRCAAR